MTHHLSDEALVKQWNNGLMVPDLAARFGCSPCTIRRRLHDLVGPLPRGGKSFTRAEGAKAARAAAKDVARVAAMPLPARLPRILPKDAPARGAAPAPAPLSALDADILRDGFTWAGRAAIAKKHGVTMGVVECRFHRLRVCAPVGDAASAPVSEPESAGASGYSNWTTNRIAEAIELRRQGLSGQDIADRFGVSRSAVLGMFKREADKAQFAGREAAE